MLAILKNDMERLWEDKVHFFVTMGLTVAAMIMAILISNVFQTKVNLAVVGENIPSVENDILKVTKLDKTPAKSDLLLGRYDAIVTFEDNGTYRMDTVKDQAFQDKLSALLAGKPMPASVDSGKRKVGTNIIGFILMFVLMQGMFYLRTFSDDKERHMVERISVSPVGFATYMTGHILFSLFLIFVPSMIVLSVCELLGVGLGFALWQYAILVAVMALAATAFAVLMTSLFSTSDSANMIGNSVIVLSSLLAGTFFEAGTKGSILSKITYLFPQKGFMEFVKTWESGTLHSKDAICLIYVIIIAILFVAIGIAKTRTDYRFKRKRVKHESKTDASITCEI